MPTLEERIALRELEMKIKKREQSMSPGAAFGLSAGTRFMDAVLGVPAAIGKAPSYIAAGVQGLVGSSGDPGVLFGGDFDFQRRLEGQDRPLLAEAGFNIPNFKTADVAGAARAMQRNPATGSSFGEAFREEKLGFEEEQAAMREQFPKATFGGDIAGDVATIVSGRMPFAKGIRDVEQKLFTSPDVYFHVIPRAGERGMKAVFKDIVTSPKMKALGRGAGRSLETGLEAASLDILHGDDPLETAVYAAAGQATGSMFLAASQAAIKGGFGQAALNIGAASFAAGSLWQIVKDMTPGGRDSIIESVEAGYEKVMLSLVLGAVAGLTGGGRIRDFDDVLVQREMPKLADAIAALPRASVISFLEKMVNAQPEEQRNAETAMNRLMQAPGNLSKDLSKKLQDAFDNGTFVDTVNKLQQESEEFRNWMNDAGND